MSGTILTKADIQAYVEKTDLKSMLEDALNKAVAEQSPDPAAFLSAHFHKLIKTGASKKKKMQAISQDASCMLDHNTKLDIYSDPALTRGTGIICTIGPKTQAVEQLTKLREAGMNIARMNFSHGSHEYHAETIANVRKSVEESPLDGKLVAIALDTKGPEIRTGSLKDSEKSVVKLEKGSKVTVTTNAAQKDECDETLIYMDYENLPKVMKVGGIIFVDDGLLELMTESIDVDAGVMVCEVMNTAELGSKKGCNLPEIDVDLPALSEKDKGDMKFAVEQNVDMVFASFIRKAEDVLEVRKCLMDADPVIGARIRIISKIENHEGMRNFDEILAVTDGVMVARGDLGIEIPTSKVFLAQKMMISKCNRAGKPVICATQMLESMTSNPRPTRAEASDVANAVLDGADCVMLSGETAKGKYPLEAVQVMAKVCKEAEAAIFYKNLVRDMEAVSNFPTDSSEAVAKALVETATCAEASLIITLTSTGTAAQLISKHRPRCPIMVLASDAHVGAACHLMRGCFPYMCPSDLIGEHGVEDEKFVEAIKMALADGLVASGQKVVLAHGVKSGKHSLSHFKLLALK